jgi:ubiquinone/menaquinone biosynthesis C-methylase UbiE
MRMNRIETLVVNNPLRAFSQRWIEARWLARRGGRLPDGIALELGCGRGEGLSIILEEFGAKSAVGIEIDPAQAERARARLAAKHRTRADLRLGDAARLEFPDRTFDGVFDFAVLHHVPEWKQALHEVNRVLKPGGRFYFEEVLRGFLETWAARKLFVHPKEGHFTSDEFVQAVEAARFQLLAAPRRIGPFFILGVARKPDSV